MPDKSKMYALLVCAASAALDVLPDTPENAKGRSILQSALYQAEEMYITAEDAETSE